MGGPLDMMYSWQSLLCAVTVVGLMKGITAAFDVRYGADKRKANRWLSIVVLPAATVLLGSLYAVVVPLRPEALDHYVTRKVAGEALQLVCYAAWGGACGQFSATLYDRVRDLLAHMTGRAAPATTEAHRPDTEGATEDRP